MELGSYHVNFCGGGGGGVGVRGFYIIHYVLLHERQMNIYLFHMTRSWHVVLVTGKKVILSLNAWASDQFYIASLVWTRDIFPVKHITHVAIAKTYTVL